MEQGLCPVCRGKKIIVSTHVLGGIFRKKCYACDGTGIIKPKPKTCGMPPGSCGGCPGRF